jgi:crossover junction endodeoxyribonuclease RuvC
MRVLGIDPGLKATGYGVIDFQKPQVKLIETGTINPKTKDSLPFRILSVYNTLNTIITELKPDVLVLEKLYSHYNHPTTAITMGHLRGAICLLCAQRDITLAEESVKRIRSAVTGNGNSGKEQTQRVVMHSLNIQNMKLALDASDALALALGYINIYGRKFQ